MTPDNAPPRTVRRSGWLGVLVVLLAIASTAGIYFWGRATIAMPACLEAARSEGKELVGYRPIDIGVRTRQAPDGECLLKGADGKIVERSLAKHLTGWANITSFALAYDLVFLASFVAWGLIIAAAARRRG
jgi:hypothetical protein